ncbi:hypothetical protein PM082_018394 [Marasmius tenuissimus]|nr:hypothetical protein PM082_018394 [Marasmius tenuissimus]
MTVRASDTTTTVRVLFKGAARVVPGPLVAYSAPTEDTGRANKIPHTIPLTDQHSGPDLVISRWSTHQQRDQSIFHRTPLVPGSAAAIAHTSIYASSAAAPPTTPLPGPAGNAQRTQSPPPPNENEQSFDFATLFSQFSSPEKLSYVDLSTSIIPRPRISDNSIHNELFERIVTPYDADAFEIFLPNMTSRTRTHISRTTSATVFL